VSSKFEKLRFEIELLNLVDNIMFNKNEKNSIVSDLFSQKDGLVFKVMSRCCDADAVIIAAQILGEHFDGNS